MVEHYKAGIEDDGYDTNLTEMEGSFESETQYGTSVRCGVPGNPLESQRIYDIVVDVDTGEVTQTRIFDEHVTQYILY